MLNLIPAQFRVAAAVLAFAVVFAAGAAGGAAVANWRAQASFADERQKCSDNAAKREALITDLRLQLTEQNGKIAMLDADTKAANDARAQAQEFADTLASFSKSRMDRLQAALSQSCGDVTRNYWELRQ